MYGGTCFYRNSGKITGVHQKIDRIARIQLNKYIPKQIKFPKIDDIIHFEGFNGPDGIRTRDSSKDVPRYVVTPTDLTDRELLDSLNDHIHNLSQALRNHNNERAAFESAWMAHAISDGLSPAHHNPMSGNFKHLIFECGMIPIVIPTKYKTICLNDDDITNLASKGFDAMFLESLSRVHSAKIYENFGRTGWTLHLFKQTNKILIPEMVKVVALAWYQAIILAQKS